MHNKNLVNMENLTKYEVTHIIGIRAEQIARGAPTNINDPLIIHDPCIVAERELVEGKIPFVINRNYPDGVKHQVLISNKNKDTSTEK